MSAGDFAFQTTANLIEGQDHSNWYQTVHFRGVSCHTKNKIKQYIFQH